MMHGHMNIKMEVPSVYISPRTQNTCTQYNQIWRVTESSETTHNFTFWVTQSILPDRTTSREMQTSLFSLLALGAWNDSEWGQSHK